MRRPTSTATFPSHPLKRARTIQHARQSRSSPPAPPPVLVSSSSKPWQKPVQILRFGITVTLPPFERGAELAEKHWVKAKAYKVEVTNPEKVRKAVKATVEESGKLDVFVANAGMAISKGNGEQTIEYKRQMAVHVDGVFYCAKYAGDVFKKQGFGNLIITSSTSAHIVNVPVDQPVYNMTKAAVTHLGKSLALEWRDFAHVNIVSPGFFDSAMGAGPESLYEAYRMTSLGRQGHVKEIKGVCLYLQAMRLHIRPAVTWLLMVVTFYHSIMNDFEATFSSKTRCDFCK